MSKRGSIVTFYSFKGGVGRSMALLNLAALLARTKKVLIIDFDLEAPGFERILRGFKRQDAERGGLLELLEGAFSQGKSTSPPADWAPYVAKVQLPEAVELDYLSSGRRSQDYSQRVQQFQWAEFFSKRRAGVFFESLRDQWMDAYDFVLIDSRTGYTDVGGVCTILLPDILALVFVANEQSLEGCVEVAHRAERARQELAVDRMPLTILPIPGKVDERTEYKLAKHWQSTFASRLAEFYEVWLPKEIQPIQVIERVTVPYVAFYSYGEELAVLRDRVTDKGSPAYAYAALADILERDFKEIGEILSGSGPPSSHRSHRFGQLPEDVRAHLNDRQVSILQQVEQQGKVTSGWCKRRFGVTYDTANRDLKGLMKLQLLNREGAGRSTRYVMSKALR